MLGFTTKKPMDSPDAYPIVAKCLGQSILIGGCNAEAYARDKPSNYKIGFKPPPQSEIQTWSREPLVPVHKRQKLPNSMWEIYYSAVIRVEGIFNCG